MVECEAGEGCQASELLESHLFRQGFSENVVRSFLEERGEGWEEEWVEGWVGKTSEGNEGEEQNGDKEKGSQEDKKEDKKEDKEEDKKKQNKKKGYGGEDGHFLSQEEEAFLREIILAQPQQQQPTKGEAFLRVLEEEVGETPISLSFRHPSLLLLSRLFIACVLYHSGLFLFP